MRLSRLLILPFLFLAAGCGLSEYEKRMDQQSLALKRFDEENKVLTDPLNLPKLVDPKTSFVDVLLPVEFFLRAPKGTVIQANNLEKASPGTVPLFCYPGPPGFNVLVSTQGIALDDKNPKPKAGTTRSKEFQPKVREALARFYEKEFKKPIDWSRADKTDKRTVQVPSTKGQPLNLIFDYQTLTDDPDPQKKNQPKDAPFKTKSAYHDFRLYFYQTGKEQAAIIYQIPSTKRNGPETNKEVDFSIRTLVLGMESSKKHQDFAKRRMKR